MLDAAMLGVLGGSIGLVWLLIRWCSSQVDREE